MRTKKPLSKRKQKHPEIREVSPVDGCGCLWWKRFFWKRYVFSLEWKSEGVMDDDSGDDEEDEGEEDWLRQGWRNETWSLFRRWVCVCVCRVQRPTRHIIGHFGDDFYRPDDQTNNAKALKETSWSSRSRLNHTRTTPPCYNNTTLGNRLYAQRKGPNVTNPICLACKNCSHKCAVDCEHCVTQSSTELFW